MKYVITVYKISYGTHFSMPKIYILGFIFNGIGEYEMEAFPPKAACVQRTSRFGIPSDGKFQCIRSTSSP